MNCLCSSCIISRILLSLSNCMLQKSLRSDSFSCKTVKGSSLMTRETMLPIFLFSWSLAISNSWIWSGICSLFVVNSTRTSFSLFFLASWASLSCTTPWNMWLKYPLQLEHKQVLHLRQYKEKSKLWCGHLLMVDEARTSVKVWFVDSLCNLRWFRHKVAPQGRHFLITGTEAWRQWVQKSFAPLCAIFMLQKRSTVGQSLFSS